MKYGVVYDYKMLMHGKGIPWHVSKNLWLLWISCEAVLRFCFVYIVIAIASVCALRHMQKERGLIYEFEKVSGYGLMETWNNVYLCINFRGY